MSAELNFAKYYSCLESTCPIRAIGRVTNVIGLVVEAQGPVSCLGTVCDIYTQNNHRIAAEVSGFKDNKVLLMPLEEIRGVGPGCRVVARQQNAVVTVGSGLLGRVIDGLGNPIDGKGPLASETAYPIYAPSLNPLLRQRIHKPLDLGVRVINGLLTVGCGQRVGVFAGSGVGKSLVKKVFAAPCWWWRPRTVCP
jgi:flagellum-specific ATP synthase